MARLLGTQYIKYLKNGVVQTYNLRVPLQHREAQLRQRRYVREALDYSVRAITTIGSGASEISGILRWEDQPAVLLDMLQSGANGDLLIWYNGVAEYTVLLIEPTADVIKLNFADQAQPDYEVEIPVVFRFTDGANAATLIGG